MTFTETVLAEVLKEVSIPDDLFDYISLLLQREEQDGFPSLRFSSTPKNSYSDVYAYYLIKYLSGISIGSKYDILLPLGTFKPVIPDMEELGFRDMFSFTKDLNDYKVPYRFKQGIRRKHTWILGETGSGKTQLIQQMILSDLQTNASIIVMDSQGDLIHKLKRSKEIDPERLVIVDPVDSVKHPLALNMFDLRLADDPVERERHLNGVVELLNFVFSSVMESSLTDKQSVVFNFCIRLMIATPNATLETFVDLLENGVSGFDTNSLPEIAQKFFESAYEGKDFYRTRQEVVRRLYSLLENPTISRIFKAPRNALNISKEMDKGKVILISTDRSLLKRDGCAFFGRYFISLVAQAMQDRLNRPEKHRRKCYLYIDECGDYLQSHDVNITDILEKGRKFNVSVTLAHQQIQQLPVEVYQSIRTNTAIKFVGACSPSDQKALQNEMGYVGQRGFPYFSCYPKGLIKLFQFKVKAGLLESTEQRTDDELETVMVMNRSKYCTDPPKVEKKPTSTYHDTEDWNTA